MTLILIAFFLVGCAWVAFQIKESKDQSKQETPPPVLDNQYVEVQPIVPAAPVKKSAPKKKAAKGKKPTTKTKR